MLLFHSRPEQLASQRQLRCRANPVEDGFVWHRQARPPTGPCTQTDRSDSHISRLLPDPRRAGRLCGGGGSFPCTW
ncbi:unnamed protein product [Symbiodinium natans]|uniref:Uncharacterized protein n=1 Tax=Symbiodinium natans TaxID=878477 RepID=A0A812USK4_9DINO|nr:unnamed protein product [Symbiodinium natans]